MKIGLLVGRFQPFHIGHLSMVNKAFKYVDYLKIGIGSSKCEGTFENPFSALERRMMIDEASKHFEHSNWDVYEIPDINDPPNWPAHVQRIVGKFDAVFTGNIEYVAKVFAEAKIANHPDIIYASRDTMTTGTGLRKDMYERKHNDWMYGHVDGMRELIIQLPGYKKFMELDIK